MSENTAEAERRQMQNEIFICADCWLSVFHLLPPSQLGLGIALLSHRFDCLVDEHFKTRKWMLGVIAIGNKIGENGKKEMKLTNFWEWRTVPIPQNPLPNKFIGFRHIRIRYIDSNVIVFLQRFRSFFASHQTNLSIKTNSGVSHFLENVVKNIWPMIKNKIGAIGFSSPDEFCRFQQLVPSILSDNCCCCQSLRAMIFYTGDLPNLPANDCANMSADQTVVKWLFSPRADGAPKVLRYSFKMNQKCPTKIDAFKRAFANAFSRANFIVYIRFRFSFWSVRVGIPTFELFNNSTGERLTLKQIYDDDKRSFLLIRCPISRDEHKWAKWEREAIEWIFDDQWSHINLSESDDDDGYDLISTCLVDTTPGPSGQQK